MNTTEERIYESTIKPEKLVDSTNWMNNQMLDVLTPLLLEKRPNTYTYAKSLAESQLIKDAKDLPLIIVRPSIIGAMWRDPLPGWTDNVNGPTGLFAAVCIGQNLIHILRKKNLFKIALKKLIQIFD